MRSYVYIGEDKQNAEITNNSVNLNVKPNENYELYPIYIGTILEFDGAKITANTFMGKSGIVNIEREVEMSGASHSKGMMILNSLFKITTFFLTYVSK